MWKNWNRYLANCHNVTLSSRTLISSSAPGGVTRVVGLLIGTTMLARWNMRNFFDGPSIPWSRTSECLLFLQAKSNPWQAHLLTSLHRILWSIIYIVICNQKFGWLITRRAYRSAKYWAEGTGEPAQSSESIAGLRIKWVSITRFLVVNLGMVAGAVPDRGCWRGHGRVDKGVWCIWGK